MKATVTGRDQNGLAVITVDGLAGLIHYLKDANPKLKRELSRKMRVLLKPVETRARANAQRVADDGTFASSIKLGSRANGEQWVLRATDPQAAVKEFAHRRARTRSSRGTPLAEARLRLRSGVGVPRGNAPRALVPAVRGEEDRIIAGVNDVIDEVLGKIGTSNG